MCVKSYLKGKTNNKTKAKKNTFLVILDVDVEEWM